ncbi:hypothetical protein, partial [Citrobacter freundii]|uniref:hypothetical protein n=1 Tax=Citrobacter freundii TaxID=546 RepID=UPI0019542201
SRGSSIALAMGSVPPSLYPKVSKKVMRALEQMGIKIIPVEKGRGRTKKYSTRTLEVINELE